MTLISDYHIQWYAFTAVPIVLWAYFFLKPQLGIFAASLFAYAVLSALWVWVFEKNRYVTINPYDQMALRYFACDSVAKLFIFTVPLMALLNKDKRLYKKAGVLFFGIFSAANVVSLIGQYIFEGCDKVNHCGGIGGNPSISMGLTICTVPLFIGEVRKKYLVLLPLLVAVILSKSSIAMVLYISFLCLYYFKPNAKTVTGIVISVCVCAAAAYVYLGNELFNSSDRVMVWKFMMARWFTLWNLPFGTGLGTYHVFSINLQNYGNIAPGSYWNTMHNDWLQGIFDMGIVGIFLMMGTYLTALLRSFNSSGKDVLTSLILFGLYIIVDPGLHWSYSCYFAAWLFLLALNRNSLQNEPITS